MYRRIELSRKTESRVRIGNATASIPDDLHHRLSEQKDLGRYPTLWSTALHAIDLGLMMMEAQQSALTERLRAISGADSPEPRAREVREEAFVRKIERR